MKSIQLILISFLTLIIFSCDTEDARTPLGITISAADFETEIIENPDADFVLGTIEAFASDESIIQYGNIIIEDSGNSKFESETPVGALDIDNVTGVLTIKDATLFDFDLNTEINASVNAYSGNVSEAVAINIFLTEILNFDSDLETLIDIYNENTVTTDDGEEIPPNLDWDITQTDVTEVSNWTGVTITANRVTALDLSGAGLTTLPSSISKLSELISLDLNTNSLTTLPESIIELENLVSLDISSNTSIDELPEIVCEAFTSDTFTFIQDGTACDGETTTDTDTSTP